MARRRINNSYVSRHRNGFPFASENFLRTATTVRGVTGGIISGLSLCLLALQLKLISDIFSTGGEWRATNQIQYWLGNGPDFANNTQTVCRHRLVEKDEIYAARKPQIAGCFARISLTCPISGTGFRNHELL